MSSQRLVLSPDTRRQQLLEAATAIFARVGYRAASITHIVQRAGVARGTFYLYFEGKSQIFRAIVDDFHDRITEMLDDTGAPPGPDEDGQALLRRGFRCWLGFFAEHRAAAAIVLKEARAIDPRFENGITELRRSALAHFAARQSRYQELGMVRATMSPGFVAHAQIGLLEEAVNAFVLDDPNADLDALADQLAAFEWNGLRLDHPRA